MPQRPSSLESEIDSFLSTLSTPAPKPQARVDTTALAPTQEQQFQAWARASGIADVDHPDSHYDYRGLFLASHGQPIPPSPNRHFPDTYKQHGHPTFSVESKYSTGPGDGGRWDGERFIPAQSPAQPAGSLDSEIDGFLSTLSKPPGPSYASMADRLKAPAMVPVAGTGRDEGRSPYLRPPTPAPGQSLSPALGGGTPQDAERATAAVARPVPTGPSYTDIETARKGQTPVTRRMDPETHRIDQAVPAGMEIPEVGPLDTLSTATQTARGAFLNAPTAIGEQVFGQSLPGHEGEGTDLLGRLAAHANLILSGQGGQVAPLGPVRAAINPPDTVSTPTNDADALHRAELGLPEARVRTRPEQIAIETGRRGMDLVAGMLTDPTALAAMGIDGPAGAILGTAFATEGVTTAATVASDPNATPEDVAEAVLGAAIAAGPLAVHIARPQIDAAVRGFTRGFREGRARRAAEDATGHQGFENAKPVGGVRAGAVVPDEGLTPITSPRPPQGPTTVAPPVAVRPGEPSVGPVAPSPEPPLDVAAAVPSTLDNEIGAFLEQLPEQLGPAAYAGPERRSDGRVSTPEQDAKYQRMRDKLARGEQTGTEELREDFAIRQRADDARRQGAVDEVSALDHEIEQTIADLTDTGEAQPRLPGAEGARKVGKADVSFKAPQQASGGDFALAGDETREAKAAREEAERGPDLLAEPEVTPEQEGWISKGFDPKTLTIHERRELGRMLKELENITFTKHSFIDDVVGKGGSMEVVGGAGGAPVFNEIGGTGSRAHMAQAIRDVLAGKTYRGKVSANGNRAIQVARARVRGDDPTLSRPMLPLSAGDEPGVTYVNVTPNMTPEESAVERPFRQAVEQRTSDKVAEYIEKFGNVVDADKAKQLAAPGADSPEFQGKFHRAVHRSSSALAGAVYRHLLEQPVAEGKQPVVDFITGPTGAGKGTIRQHAAMTEALADSDIIVDGPLSGLWNAQHRIQAALDSGRSVHVVYVHRDPVDAWHHGVVTRTATEGRKTPLDYHVQSHVEGVETIKKLVDAYGDHPKVSIEIIRNRTHEEPESISAADLPEAYNEGDVRAAIEAHRPAESEVAAARDTRAEGDERGDAGAPRDVGEKPEHPPEVAAPTPPARASKPPVSPAVSDKPPKIKNPRSLNEAFLAALKPFKGSDGQWYYVDTRQPDFRNVTKLDDDGFPAKVRGFYPGSEFYGDDIPGVTFKGNYERPEGAGEIEPTTPTKAEHDAARSGPSFMERLTAKRDTPATAASPGAPRRTTGDTPITSSAAPAAARPGSQTPVTDPLTALIARYKPGNPFAKRAAFARALADQLNRPTSHERGMADAFPLGAGFGHGSESSRSTKVDASVGRAASAVKASKDADYLEGQSAAFDRGEINAQGRSISEGSTRRSDKRAAAQRRREARILNAKKQRGDKLAWQVPPDVWADSTGNLGGGARDLILAEHREAVEAAVRDGKDVPADVRQAYPDLAAAEPPHEFSSTQVELPPAISSKIRQLADSIPDSELGEDGREDKPHVTVKFGLHTNDIADVRRVLAGEAPITLTFGKTSLFPAKEGADYDVVKVDVDSPDLHRLNAKIAGALEHTDTHPNYKPHVTIAYVKAGLGKKYAGLTDLEGQTVTLDAVTFSDKNRHKIAVPLTGVREKALPTQAPVTPLKAQSSTTAPRAGRTPVATGTTLQATVVPGAKEFIEQDVAPVVQAAAEQVDAARKDIRTLFAPDTAGDGARVFADVLRAGLAAHAQRVQRAQHVLRGLEKAFDHRSNEENLAFMDAIETGSVETLPADLQAAAKQLRDLLTAKRTEVQKRGKLQSYIQNYFPHEWKQPTKAKDLIRRILGKRPLQGPKTFLKKRSIPTVAEGVALGLEPASYNPVTLVLHKLAEMDKWVMAHDVLRESKSLGVAKFVRAGGAPPEGWQRYHDSFGTVYAPPFVKVHEAFDSRLMEKLHEFATSLGITTVRKVKIAQKGSGVGSDAWGYAIANPDGTNARIATKFAGPETVLEHEIGHILDWKYGLWDKISRELDDEQFDARERHPARELRDLADRRFEGEPEVKASFKKYVRKKEEKIANLVHAFIYNPTLAKEVAPNAYWALYNLATDNPELAPLIDLQKTKSLVLGTSTTDQRVNGTVISGHYYGPPDAVRILNNYLSPGLRGNAMFDAYRTAGNFLNQVQLGLSGFHLTMTGIEAMVSKLAQGIEELSRGELGHAGRTIAEAPVATITTLFKGHRALKELYARDANLRTIVGVADLVAQGGGGVHRDKTMRAYEDRVEATLKALRQGNVIGAAVRVPAALFELPTKFVMEWWVPRLKLGAFLDMARMELRTLGPEPSLADVRRVLGGVQDSIDNRFGQLVYDNLFWHNALKDAGMGAVRALGWNVGTIREVFGAPTGQAKHLLNRPTRLRDTGERGEEGAPVYTRDKDPWLTHKAAYVVALAVGIGLISALYEYLHTGERPKELRDLAFPRTGGKRPDGKDERVSFPSYFKDVYAFFHDLPTSATETVGHKLQPLLNLLYETWSNEDYYGTEIRNADDPLVQQLQDYVTFLGEQVKPISLRSFDQRRQDRGETGISGAESFFGVTPAPASVYRSRAEERMRKYLPQQGRTKREAEASQMKRDLKEAVRNEDRAAAEAALATGELSRRQVEGAVRTSRLTPLQAGFQRLTLDQALKVWGVASPEERASVRSLLQRKAESALSSAPPADVPGLVQRVKAALAMPISGGVPVTQRPAASAGRTPVTAR